MTLRRQLNKVPLSQWVNIMRHLRPSVTAEDIHNLVAWRYKFITSSRNNKAVGVGTYYSTSSLIKGRFNYLADLVVEEKYRSKGVGAEMMSKILIPNFSCELDSGLQRTDAHRFYHKLGFIHSGYAVRSQVPPSEAMENLPQQSTYLMDGINRLKDQGENKQKQIQAFIDECTKLNTCYQANLKLFMMNNPNHHLLILQSKAGELEGVLLFELQNRLSIGGNCFHVTDLIVKNKPGGKEKQNTLLLSLLQHAKNYNSHDRASSIRAVIVEMTEEEIKKHKLPRIDQTNKLSEDKNTAPININSFFSVTAKHFAKTVFVSDTNRLPSGNWYQKHGN